VNSRFVVAALMLIGASFGSSCDPPKPPPSPPSEVGDACGEIDGEDESCSKGFFCLTRGEPEGTCETLDGCEDRCDCNFDAVCPEGSFSRACLAFGSRVNFDCAEAAGEGEGEGE